MFNSRKRSSARCKDSVPSDKDQTDSSLPSSMQTKTTAPLFEMLEPRLLYSADALGIGAVVLPDESSADHQHFVSEFSDRAQDDSESPHVEISEASAGSIELVFIDSRVNDTHVFVDTWAADNVEFVIVHESDDALSVIGERLEDHAANGNRVETIRIVSHGSSGQLLLGDSNISESTLLSNADALQMWSTALSADADILLFGCDVGAGKIGQAFVQTLAELTDADVAASDDVTGASALGGDWDLEVSYGATRHLEPNDTNRLAQWTHSLATITVNYYADNIAFDPNITASDLASAPNVSLRMAVVAANNTAGDDIIELVNNANPYLIGNQSLDIGVAGGGNLTLVNNTGGDVEFNPDPGQSDSRFFTLRLGTFEIIGDPNSVGDQMIFANAKPLGHGGAILTQNNTVLTVSNAKFDSNQPNPGTLNASGGAIYAQGDLTVIDSEFISNKGENGGAIYVDIGTGFSITGSLFDTNLSWGTGGGPNGGGAVYASSNGLIKDSVFIQNYSEILGGAVYSNTAQITVEDSLFDNNDAPEGAAIFSISTATTDVLNSTFSNHADGGAIASNGTINVDGSLFENNSEIANNAEGGAIHGETVNVNNSVFHNNFANGEGGAIYSNHLVVTNSIFTENESAKHGGAIRSTGSIDISGSHFQLNESSGSLSTGGAVSSNGPGSIKNSSFVANVSGVGSAVMTDVAAGETMEIEKVTFSGNTARISAAFSPLGAGTTTINASTFAENDATALAGAVVGEGIGSVTVSSSIFFQNTLSATTAADIWLVNSTVGNVFDTNTDANPNTDIVSTTINLGPLTTAPNSVVQVRPLQSGSAAINAGASIDPGTAQPFTDSQAMPLDGLPDIGASEYQGDSDTLYWSDENGQIWRSNSDFSNAVMVLDTASDPRFSGTAHDITGLSIDFNGADNSGNARLYWVDRTTGNVWFTGLDGSGSSVVMVQAITMPVGPTPQSYVFSPNSIAFDPDRDILFLTHGFVPYHPPAIRIWEINEFNSSFIGEIENPDPTLNYSMVEPRDIYYSDVTGRIYWIDGVSDAQAAANQAAAIASGETNPQNVTPIVSTIHSTLADGTGYELLHQSSFTTDDFRGITMDDDAGYLYFSNIHTQSIHRLELATGIVTTSANVATLGNLDGTGDLTFLSGADLLIATNTETNEIHTFDTDLNLLSTAYTHPSKPIAVTTASTSNASNPTFYTDIISYTEGEPAIDVNANHLVINDPSGNGGANLDFIMVGAPSLGGVLLADGIPVSLNGTFSLDQTITFESHDISFETTEVIQLQLTDGVYTSPTKAFYVTIIPVDDPAVVTISDMTIDENSPPQTLNVSQFNFYDEEGDVPHSYSITPQGNLQGLVVEVASGPNNNSFTHAQLVAGDVTISSEATIITDPFATTNEIVVFDIQPFATNGEPITAQNPLEAGVPTTLTVEIIPMDDQAELTAHASVNINDNSVSNLNAVGGLLLADEESGNTPLSYTVLDLPDPTFVTLEVAGIPMLTPGSFTHAQLLNGEVTLNATDANVGNTIETTAIKLFAVTDPSNPTSDSNPVVIVLNLQPQDDRPEAEINLPAGLDANENETTLIPDTIFIYEDEEFHPLDFFEIVSVSEATTSAHIPNVLITKDGTPLFNGGSFTLADLQNNLIEIDAKNADFANDMTLNITLRAHSQGSPLVSGDFVLQINLKSVNDAPVLTIYQDNFTVIEGGPIVTIPAGNFLFTDEEGDPVDTVEFQPLTLPAGVTMTPTANPFVTSVNSTMEQSVSIEVDAQNGIMPGPTPFVQTIAVNSTQTNTLDGTPGQSSNTETFTLTIVPTDDAPTLTTQAQQMSEGDTLVLDTTMLNYQDEESPTDATFTLSAVGDVGGALLYINGTNNGSSGTFQYSDLVAGLVEIRTDQADYPDGADSTILFDVQVESGTAQVAATQQLSIQITPVNEPASLTIAAGPFTIDEHTSAALPSSSFTLNDEETGFPQSYQINSSLVGKPYQLMIDGNPTPLLQNDTFTHQDLIDGKVILSAENSVLLNDFTDTIFLTALLTDGTQSVGPAPFNIQILEVDDAPTLAPVGFSLTEGQTQTLNASHFNFSDEETPNSAVYTINALNSTGGADFIVNNTPLGTSGVTFTHSDLINNQVVFSTSNADYLDAQIATLNFEVQVESGGQTSTKEPLVIYVNPFNEKPVFTIAPNTINVLENGTGVLNGNSFFIEDEEDDIPVSYQINTDLSTSPYRIEIAGSNTPLAQGDTFSHADLIAGNIIINATGANLQTAVTQNVELIALMSAGLDSDPTDLSITINPVNDAATIKPILLSTPEGTLTQLSAATFNYTDEEDANYRFELSDVSVSNDTVIVADGNILEAGDSFFHQDLLDGKVFLSTENTVIEDNSNSFVVFKLSAIPSNGPSSAITNFNVMVVATNDSPTLAPSLEQLNENSTLEINESMFGYLDEEDDPVNHYVIDAVASYPGLALTLDGVTVINGQQVSPTDIQNGKLILDATNIDVPTSQFVTIDLHAVSTDGNASSTESVFVLLNPTNDAAVLSAQATALSIDEGTIETLSNNSFMFTDEENANVVHYVVQALPVESGVAVQNNGLDLQLGDTFTQQDITNGVVTINALNAPVLISAIDGFSVFAVLDDGTNTNTATLALQFNKVEDIPTLSIPGPIEAYENALTTVTTDMFLVDDLDGDLPASYTVVQAIPDTTGYLMLNNQPILAGDSFTQADLQSGLVQIDLQSLEISSASSTSFLLAVTAGQETSIPTTVPVFIHAVNDAPELVAPISLPTLTAEAPTALPLNAFTDPDGDNITYSAMVIGDDPSSIEPLPAWITFDPVTQAFTLNDAPTVEFLNIRIVAQDTNNATSATEITLQFEPRIAPALPVQPPEPAPVELQAVNTPDIDVDGFIDINNSNNLGVEIEEPEPEPEPEPTADDAEPKNLPNSQDNGVPTTDIESSRINLAELLPTLERAGAASNNNVQSEGLNSELAKLLGFTNDVSAIDNFRLDDLESTNYKRSLDNLAARWNSDDEALDNALIDIDATVGTSVGLSSGFTVGYMIWLLRGGTLMGSVLSSLPAWRLVDPLPVLAELDEGLDDDNESLESMVSNADEEAERLSASN